MFKLKTDFSIYQLSTGLHAFAESMIYIFIPIFLLEIGYSVPAVIFYHFIFNLFDVPLNFSARWLIRKWGARKVVILSSVFFIGFFVCLYALTPDNWIFLGITAFLAALYDAFYWVAHLYLFMRCSKNDDNVSGDVGWLSIVQSAAGIVAPFLGGLIAVWAGRQISVAAAAVILAISMIPLFFIKNILDKPRRPQLSFRHFFDGWDSIKDYLAAGFYNIHCSVEWVIWPMFIFIFFGNIESVAALSIISSITAIIFTYFVGKLGKEKRIKAVAFGGLAIAGIWVLRLIFSGAVFYYLSVFLVSLFSVAISIPLDSNIFEKGEKREVLSSSMYRNVVNMGANAVLFGLLLVLVKFNVSFIFAAACLLVMVYIGRLSFYREEKK